MEGNTYSIQLTDKKKGGGGQLRLPHASWDVCVCVGKACVCVSVCVSLVDTCGAIMTAPAHLSSRIALGYRPALVRHVAG